MSRKIKMEQETNDKEGDRGRKRKANGKKGKMNRKGKKEYGTNDNEGDRGRKWEEKNRGRGKNR